MKRLLFLSLLALLFCAQRAAAQPYELQYNPANGNVTIDTLESTFPLQLVFLRSTTFQFNQLALNPFLPDMIGKTPRSDVIRVYSPFPATPAEAVQIDPTTAPYISGTHWNMGNILPAGLDEQGLADAVTDARFSPVSNIPGPRLQLVIVPEPGSLAALGLAGTPLLRRQRRGVWARFAF